MTATSARSRKKSKAKVTKKAAAKKTAKKKTAKKTTAKKKSVAKKVAKKKAPGRKAAKKKVAPKKTAKAPSGSAKKTARKAPTPSKTVSTRAKKTKKGKARRRPLSPTAIRRHRKQWSSFRELLLKRQQDLTQAYNVSKGDSRSRQDDGTEDYIDYAVSSYAREFLLSLTELDRKQLMLVEEALKRIDRGDYGRCQQCGTEIVVKRLEVAPWARHCVRCQELEEQGLLPEHSVSDDEDDYDVEDFDDEEAFDDDELEPEEDESEESDGSLDEDEDED